MKSPLKFWCDFSIVSTHWRPRVRPQLPTKQQVRKRSARYMDRTSDHITERTDLGTGGINIELIIFTNVEYIVFQ